MASVLPFDNAVIGSQTIPASEFVSGSGSITLKGEDTATTTSDGRIHNDRVAVNSDSSFELYGDHTDLDSGTGLGDSVVYKNGSTEVFSGTGLVSAEYSKEKHTTSISISGDPS